MVVSYNWLQEYFNEPLPKPENLVELITRKAYEVEDLEKVDDDYVLDIDVLPNRAHDSLCHRGIAREISVLTGLAFKEGVSGALEENAELSVNVEIEEPALCRRYIGKQVSGIKVGPSPEWLSKSLEVIGQKPINNIVDITNFVMFDLGQPMHAFDADKVEGKIVVRKARAGEHITTLDGQEVDLDMDILIIADEKDPLAIAGIKGGMKAIVDENTTSIILEAANFHPGETRKASTRIGIKTDSSKRFENELSPALAKEAIGKAIELIKKEVNSAEVGVSTDMYTEKQEDISVAMGVEKVNKLLGSEMTKEDIREVLNKLQFTYTQDGETFTVDIPNLRLDLRIEEDLIEEIGRIYGYDNIKERVFENEKNIPVNKLFYYAHKIRNILQSEGYSEAYLYTIVSKGEVQVANPIARDKTFLRTSLIPGVKDVLSLNSKNAALLGAGKLKMFEIGNVFSKGHEYAALCIGVWAPKEKIATEMLENTIRLLSETLDISISEKVINKDGAVLEVNLEELIKELPGVESYEDELAVPKEDVEYRPFSSYPFVARDIAVFVPEGTDQGAIEEVVRNNAGDLLVRGPDLFDRFEKKNKETGEVEKVSYAFSIVFQSQERTLTDEEVNEIMVKITENLNIQSGWEVR